MTSQVKDACQALGLTLHDHLIIGKERELSFRAERYL
jgi:DNA repair protein RadC